MHQHQHLAFAVEAAGVVISDNILAKVLHHRPVREPAKALGHVEPVAVQRAQFDDAQPVKPSQQGHAFGVAEGVGRDDLLERPMAQAADRGEQQFAVADDGLLLLRRQLAAQWLRVGDLAREFGEIHLQHAQHFIDARQRHVGLRKDTLDARLGQPQVPGQLGVSDAGGLQLGLQRAHQVLRRAHRRGSDRPIGYRETIPDGRDMATQRAVLDTRRRRETRSDLGAAPVDRLGP